MFFYLLNNSTIIQELDEFNKSIKILIYGGIAYIVVHAVLFIGGTDSLLYSLKLYFWLFLILDIIVIFLIFKKKHKKLFETIFGTINNKKILNDTNKNKYNLKKQLNSNTIINQPTHFNNEHNQNNEHIGFSESDSDIDSDIDISSFKESLYNN